MASCACNVLPQVHITFSHPELSEGKDRETAVVKVKFVYYGLHTAFNQCFIHVCARISIFGFIRVMTAVWPKLFTRRACI